MAFTKVCWKYTRIIRWRKKNYKINNLLKKKTRIDFLFRQNSNSSDSNTKQIKTLVTMPYIFVCKNFIGCSLFKSKLFVDNFTSKYEDKITSKDLKRSEKTGIKLGIYLCTPFGCLTPTNIHNQQWFVISFFF